jgi:soluble lytic murein transglycosylase
MKNNILLAARFYILSIIYIVAIFLVQFKCFAFDLVTKQEIAIIKNINSFKNINDFDKAITKANNNKLRELAQLLYFLKYKKHSSNNFEDLHNFHCDISYWPISADLSLIIEGSINYKDNTDKILQWFAKHPPRTLDGNKKNLAALLKNNAIAEKTTPLIKKIFIKSNFTEEQREAFLKKHKNIINNDDILARINHLLSVKKFKEAQIELRSIPKKDQEVIKARIKLQNENLNIDKFVNQINPAIILNEGFLYDIIKYHDSCDNIIKVQQYFAKLQMPIKNYQNWWGLKNRVIRSLLENKYYTIAYKLTSSNQSTDIADKIDAEWLSGWIALRFRDRPDDAIKHFLKMSTLTKTPVSKARAYYWLGRSHLIKNNQQEAENAFKNAAQYSHTFYGQLSYYIINKNKKIKVKKTNINITEQHYKQLAKNKFAKIALLASFIQNHSYMHSFIREAVNSSQSPEVIYLLAQEGIKLGKKDFAVQVAKEASLNKIMLPKFNYPVINIDNANKVSTAFIHALIRQESLFSTTGRVSSAGALGLMQIMPKTGAVLADALGEKFDEKKLLHDQNYNLRLGVSYLNQLHKEFDGNYILMAAAYNAGSGNVKKWIKRFGDPRKLANLNMVIDWVELIPFEETRNYVMRILETKQIYHIILPNNTQHTENLEKDLYKK